MLQAVKSRIEEYTLAFTEIPSAVSSTGEADMAAYIYNQLKQSPYFQAHPENLFLEPVTENDPFGRSTVVALVEGAKDGSSRETVILLGHIDTEGYEDYGALRDLATRPAELKEAMRGMDLPEDIRRDLEGDDWLFGRGILDMKCGVAAHVAMIEEAARHPENLRGNLLLFSEPDEEANSSGMFAADRAARRLKEQRGLEYLAVINTDWMTGRYEGDENKYIYIGTVGKLLPSFYAIGKPTHVSQAFEGIDANVLASELVREISLSEDLCDVADGESTVPPISLRQQDLKKVYTIQTAAYASVYFNFATHSMQPGDILESLSKRPKRRFEM